MCGGFGISGHYGSALTFAVLTNAMGNWSQAIMTMPEKQAKRIYGRFYLGLTVKEIAELEGVHTSSVYDSIQRGLHTLKNILLFF